MSALNCRLSSSFFSQRSKDVFGANNQYDFTPLYIWSVQKWYAYACQILPFVVYIKRTYHTWLNVGILECFDLSSHLINLAIECLHSLIFLLLVSMLIKCHFWFDCWCILGPFSKLRLHFYLFALAPTYQHPWNYWSTKRKRRLQEKKWM